MCSFNEIASKFIVIHIQCLTNKTEQFKPPTHYKGHTMDVNLLTPMKQPFNLHSFLLQGHLDLQAILRGFVVFF